MKFKNPGVTLLELTVVFAVIFVIASISYPSFNSFLQYQDLKNNTKNFISRLKLAQQQTVSQQLKFAVEFDLNAPAYRQLKLVQPVEVVFSYLLSEDVFFASSTGVTNSRVVFNPTGAVDQSGEIFLQSTASGQQTRITIHPSGYVTWQNN